MPYIPHTDEEVREMLSTIGVDSIDDLFANIPEAARNPRMDLPEAISEPELMRILKERLAPADRICLSFAGGGAYHHNVPAATWRLATRGEFLTAYTPYQAEASQGTLQAIFEYQTMMCRLTGMDVSNASMYDAASGLAEAALMAVRKTRRMKIVAAGSVNPIHRQVVRTQVSCQPIQVVTIDTPEGVMTPAMLDGALSDAACLLVQYPNFYGCIEDVAALGEKAHAAGALLIVSAYPIALGILRTPGELGADICVGELQSLGIPLSFGGPHGGFMTCKNDLIRQMPGRIVGMATDKEGRPGYCLTLQTREQHIRREKATSNICSNQSLIALAASITLALWGKQGLREIATACAENAHYAFDRLCALPGVTAPYSAPFFNEFVIRFDPPERLTRVMAQCLAQGLQPGVPLSRFGLPAPADLLVAATEVNLKSDIDTLVDFVGGVK
ncbi:aminomethyl-transferring glycine dehydrogenase subunit GcvPA [bacterium]|nr:aminomethyl-transferring glycine dehydrogenase subunit GcvPA [bacterium]